jgi:hypothetical protein
MVRRTRAGQVLWLPFTVILAAAGSLAAQAPTNVGVSVELEASHFRTAFGPRAGVVEAAAADIFAARLTEHIGFVRFRPRDTSAEYRLVFSLDQSVPGSNDEFPEYGFWARLERPGDTPVELYWLMLRPRESADHRVGSEQDFLGEVAAKLARPDLTAIRQELLSKIPITRQALTSDSPLGWALPLSRNALCLKQRSILLMVGALPAGPMILDREYEAIVARDDFKVTTPLPQHAPFLSKLFSEPRTPESRQDLQSALQAGGLEIKEVYVLDHQHDANACRLRPLDPGTANPGGAS